MFTIKVDKIVDGTETDIMVDIETDMILVDVETALGGIHKLRHTLRGAEGVDEV